MDRETLAKLLSLASVFIGVWILWEAVIRPLRNIAGWDREFPSPFYIFEAPIWFWHDLGMTLIVVGALVLAYYAFRNCYAFEVR